jgi:hypothetical protein
MNMNLWNLAQSNHSIISKKHHMFKGILPAFGWISIIEPYQTNPFSFSVMISYILPIGNLV